MLRNISINIVSQGYLFLLSFLTLPVILHAIGKEQFGFLALAAALLNYATAFDFGFGAALTQKVAQIHSQANEIELSKFIQTGLLLYFFFAAAATIALNIFGMPLLHLLRLSPTLQPIAQDILPIISLNIGLYFLTIYTTAIFQGFEQFARYNIRTFIVGTANTVGTALLVQNHYPLAAVFRLQTIALLATLAINFWLLRSYISFPHFSKIHFFNLGKFAFFKFLSNSAGQINNQFPKFFLASFVSVASVSYFTIPFSLIQKLSVLLSQAYIVIFPKTANLQGKNQHQYIRQLFFKGQFVVAAFMAIAVTVGFLLGPSFLNWWLKDPAFVAHIIPIFNILLIAYFLHALTAIPVAIFEGLGNTKIPALLAWVNTAIVIGLGPFLIKNFQARGGAELILAYTLITAPAIITLALRLLYKEVAAKANQ